MKIPRLNKIGKINIITSAITIIVLDIGFYIYHYYHGGISPRYVSNRLSFFISFVGMAIIINLIISRKK